MFPRQSWWGWGGGGGGGGGGLTRMHEVVVTDVELENARQALKKKARNV